jgi:hypothetical protein
MKGHLRRCFAIREEGDDHQPLLRSGSDCRAALRAHGFRRGVLQYAPTGAQGAPSAGHLAFPEQAPNWISGQPARCD